MHQEELTPDEQELIRIEQENILSGNEITGQDGKTREVDDKLIGDDLAIKKATEQTGPGNDSNARTTDNSY